MIKIEQLQQFLAVCQHHSLMEAAKQLNRTPSAVSMTLKHLEESLDGPLFEGDRKQQLTPLGRFVRDSAARSVGEHLRVLDSIARYSRGESGSVRIIAVPSAATEQLPLAIAQCGIDQLELHIELRDTDSRAVLSAVLDGSADLGVASLATRDNRLDQRLLRTDAFSCVVARDHPLANRRHPLKWSDLSEHKFIHNGLCEHIDHAIIRQLSEASQLHVFNVASILAFVQQGMGISLLPASAVTHLESVVSLPIDEPDANRSLYLLTRTDRTPSPAVQRISDAIVSQFENAP